MLKDVLKEINNSKYVSKAKMAVKLNKTEEVIEDVFSQLNRMGYIEEDQGVNNCTISCGNCPYARTCGKMPVNSIKITEKGLNLLRK